MRYLELSFENMWANKLFFISILNLNSIAAAPTPATSPTPDSQTSSPSSASGNSSSIGLISGLVCGGLILLAVAGLSSVYMYWKSKTRISRAMPSKKRKHKMGKNSAEPLVKAKPKSSGSIHTPIKEIPQFPLANNPSFSESGIPSSADKLREGGSSMGFNALDSFSEIQPSTYHRSSSAAKNDSSSLSYSHSSSDFSSPFVPSPSPITNSASQFDSFIAPPLLLDNDNYQARSIIPLSLSAGADGTASCMHSPSMSGSSQPHSFTLSFHNPHSFSDD